MTGLPASRTKGPAREMMGLPASLSRKLANILRRRECGFFLPSSALAKGKKGSTLFFASCASATTSHRAGRGRLGRRRRRERLA